MFPLRCSTSCLSENPVYAFTTIRAIFAEGLKMFRRPGCCRDRPAAFAIRSNGNTEWSLPSSLSWKLLRYLSRISNSVNPKVGWISEIFCTFAISLLENFPRFGCQTLFAGEYLKIQKSQLIRNILCMNYLANFIVFTECP